MTLKDVSTTPELDRFFKSVSPDWYRAEGGNVEAPTGWFGLLEVDTEFRQAHSSTSIKRENSEMPESPEVHDGLYLVRIDNSGLVWVYASSRDDEEEVRDEYVSLARDFAAWEAEEDFTADEPRVLVDPSKLVLGPGKHMNTLYPGSEHPSEGCVDPACSLSTSEAERKRLLGSAQLQEVYKYLDNAVNGDTLLSWYGQCRAQEMSHREAILDTVKRYKLREQDYWQHRFPEGDGLTELDA